MVIGIIGIMATAGTVGISAGRSRSRLAGATRDVLAAMRQARSIALITQKPSIITYSNSTVDDEAAASVMVKTQPLFDGNDNPGEQVYTLDGEPVVEDDENRRRPGSGHATVKKTDGDDASSQDGGESLAEYLSPKISLEITRGLKIKVLKGDERLESSQTKVYKSSISVFSTADWVKSSFSGEKSDAKTETPQGAPGSQPAPAAGAEDGPVEIVWQTNGRTEAHVVYVYPEGSDPEKGLSIEVDKFGDCRVSQWKEDR